MTAREIHKRRKGGVADGAAPLLSHDLARPVALLAIIVVVCALVVFGVSQCAGGGAAVGGEEPEVPVQHDERPEVTTTLSAYDADADGMVDGAYNVKDLNAAARPEGEGWVEGDASAYSAEDNDGGTATASGIPLDDESFTVAVPQSEADMLGAQVEVFYGGITVRATVTDTGSFGDYGRELDLAPAVWEAFGASSIDDWGVRAVLYRYVAA